MTAVTQASAAEILCDWAAAELMPWRFVRQPREAFEAGIRKSVEEDLSVFRFTIRNGTVAFDPKAIEQFPSPEAHQDFIKRCEYYTRFLQSVVVATGIGGTADLAIDLDDLADRVSDGPVFCFQKVRGSRTILIPDIDFLDWNFYLAGRGDDHMDFLDKRDSAIFVGSTTGMLNISREIIEQGAHQRIRSALYFKGHADIRYELPGVVQCDGPETEAFIRSLGLGSTPCSWEEQLTHRYLMSVDGNGATCSRVAIGLKSNSVLMRYLSVNDLYYFHGLRAWQHYVPLNRDSDVADNLALLRRNPELPLAIARESRDFYRTYLSRIAVMHYTAELLRGYIALFGDPAPADPNASLFLIDCFAHVTNQGDIWSQPNDWVEGAEGNWIEGIGVIAGPGIAPGDLAVRGVDGDDRLDFVGSWALSGSRGQGRPLRGFEARLSGTAAERYSLAYEARFLDGTSAGPVRAGHLCVSATGAPLTALRFIARDNGSSLADQAAA